MSNLTPPAAPTPPVQPLFRKQALEHVGARQFGNVILSNPVSHRVLTMGFCALGIAIILFFVFFSTTRKAQCQGVLLPTAGVSRVLATQAGVVSQKNVVEGQLVTAGDILFVLSSERSSVGTSATQKTISTLMQSRRDSFNTELSQAQLQSKQRLAVTERRSADLAAEITRTEAQIALQQTRVNLAEEAVRRYGELLATHYISAAQFQDKQAELLDQRQRAAELLRVKASLHRDVAAAQAEIGDVRLQAVRDANALRRSVSSLEQDLTENEARREIVVRAQQSGMVTAIVAEVGQSVTAASPLATILPKGAALEAELYAPSRSAGFIRPGMTVLLRYQAYPYQKFGQHTAKVYEVANMSIRADELALRGAVVAPSSEPLYRIRLKLDQQSLQAYGKTMPLKAGMLVDASVVLEQRRLYEWILDPLFSISGRI